MKRGLKSLAEDALHDVEDAADSVSVLPDSISWLEEGRES